MFRTPLSKVSAKAPSLSLTLRARLRRGGLMRAAAVVVPVLMLVWLWASLPQLSPAPPLPHRATEASDLTSVLPSQKKLQSNHVPRRAQFGNQHASDEARQVANWALYSGDNQGRAVVVVDKKEAQVYVFDADGELKGATAALMGSAIGDHTVPGVGDKPIAQVLPEERTTPAGRFVAEPGLNAHGEDVVWVDYDAAVSMHRVRPNVKAERRLERLASRTAEDNRISYGCINLPVSFYETVLRPMVSGPGAVVYVLPETQPVAPFFGASDLPRVAPLAQR